LEAITKQKECIKFYSEIFRADQISYNTHTKYSIDQEFIMSSRISVHQKEISKRKERKKEKQTNKQKEQKNSGLFQS
jgi:hypothetical protein